MTKQSKRRFRLVTVACLSMAAALLILSSCVPSQATDGNFSLSGGLPGATLTPPGDDSFVSAGEVTLNPTATPAPSPAAVGTAAVEDAAAVTPSADEYQPVQFAGPVEELPAGGEWSGTWRVGGQTVQVAPTTEINEEQGPLAHGSLVEVEGWKRPDGAINAGWIRVTESSEQDATRPAQASATPRALPPRAATAQAEAPVTRGNPHGRPVEFRGTIDSLPAEGLIGIWQVDGKRLNVNAGTRIQQKHGRIAEDAYVQVKGWLQPDGTINAAQIQTKSRPDDDKQQKQDDDKQDKDKDKQNRDEDKRDNPGNNGKGNGNGNKGGNGN